MRILNELLQEEKAIDKRLEAEKLNDPEEIEKILIKAKQNKEAADRWTDNVWALKHYLVKKKGMNSKDVNKQMGITGDFDYPIFKESTMKPKK